MNEWLSLFATECFTVAYRLPQIRKFEETSSDGSFDFLHFKFVDLVGSLEFKLNMLKSKNYRTHFYVFNLDFKYESRKFLNPLWGIYIIPMCINLGKFSSTAATPSSFKSFSVKTFPMFEWIFVVFNSYDDVPTR